MGRVGPRRPGAALLARRGGAAGRRPQRPHSRSLPLPRSCRRRGHALLPQPQGLHISFLVDFLCTRDCDLLETGKMCRCRQNKYFRDNYNEADTRKRMKNNLNMEL